jgi:hypothetical protein
VVPGRSAIRASITSVPGTPGRPARDHRTDEIAPKAFASSLAEEQRYGEAAWRGWLHPGRGMKAVASADTTWVGVIGASVPTDRHGAVELYSMWVRPSWRGRLTIRAASVMA